MKLKLTRPCDFKATLHPDLHLSRETEKTNTNTATLPSQDIAFIEAFGDHF